MRRYWIRYTQGSTNRRNNACQCLSWSSSKLNWILYAFTSLIRVFSTSSLDYRAQAAQYLTILMLSHPIIHEYLLSQGTHVAAEMALHGAKNQVGACDEGSQDMPNLLSLYELSTALSVNPVRWSVNEVFRRKPSLNVDVWREYMENDLGLCHKE
jgi:hypothetical protein